MQIRKILVEIKTLDDEYCSKHCEFYNCGWKGHQCGLSGLVTPLAFMTVNGKTKILRTVECKRREVKDER